MRVYLKSTKIRKMTIVFRSARYNLRLVYLFKMLQKIELNEVLRSMKYV